MLLPNPNRGKVRVLNPRKLMLVLAIWFLPLSFLGSILLTRVKVRDWVDFMCLLSGHPRLPPRSTVQVSGFTTPSFSSLKPLFQQSFADGREIGAQLAVYKDGELVVDLWGGSADVGAGSWEAVTGDTVVPVFSCTKVAESVVLGMLVDRGHLKYDGAIASYWPEFAAANKSHITVAQLMRHQGGLAAPSESLPLPLLSDFDALASFLARQPPNWEVLPAGETQHPRQMYHAITRGLFANELVRRTDPNARSLGRFFEEEVADVFGMDFSIGERDGDDATRTKRKQRHIAKVLEPPLPLLVKYLLQYLLPLEEAQRAAFLFNGDRHDVLQDSEISNLRSIFARALQLDFAASRILVRSLSAFKGASSLSFANREDVRKVEIASANGIASARAMAKLGAVVVSRGVGNKADSVFRTEEGKRAFGAPGSRTFCEGLGFNITFTAGGMGLDRFDFYGLPGWVGWAGAGGSVLLWNEEMQMSFAYMTVQPYARIAKPRAVKLLRELHGIVAQEMSSTMECRGKEETCST